MVLGISSSLVAGVLEAWYLGQLGTLTLAAYGFTFPVSGALMSVSLGISIGVSSVLARTVGEGDHTLARRLATDGIFLVGLAMIVLTIVGLVTIESLFTLLGADSTTLPLVSEYMSIYYLSLVFLAIPSVGANALRATGDARISGTIMVAGSVLQIILGPMFIFGWLGIPALGLAGAAIAHLLARVLIFLVTLYVLIFRERLLTLVGLSLSSLLDSWRRILVISVPAVATNLVGPVSTAIIISFLAGFGQEAVAGFGIASRLEGLFVIPLFALSASIGPFVGQNWGGKFFQRANEAMLLSFRWSIIWGLLVAVLLFFSAPYLIPVFDDDPQVLEVASLYLLVVPVSYGCWGLLMMGSAIFNSLGRPVSSTIMSICRMIVIYVPLAALGQWLFGVIGIFAAAAAANVIMGLVAFRWNRIVYAGMK